MLERKCSPDLNGHTRRRGEKPAFLPDLSPRTLCLFWVFIVLMKLIVQIEIMTITFRQSLLESIHGVALSCSHKM